MHDHMATKQARSRVKYPHWWDNQNLITRKFTKNEFVARVMDHMADQDEPVGSNPPTWNFPGSDIILKADTPFNAQELRRLSAGLHTHDVEEGMMDEEMSEGDLQESSPAIRSVVTVPTAHHLWEANNKNTHLVATLHHFLNSNGGSLRPLSAIMWLYSTPPSQS